jgi:hypothetical protein
MNTLPVRFVQSDCACFALTDYLWVAELWCKLEWPTRFGIILHFLLGVSRAQKTGRVVMFGFRASHCGTSQEKIERRPIFRQTTYQWRRILLLSLHCWTHCTEESSLACCMGYLRVVRSRIANAGTGLIFRLLIVGIPSIFRNAITT